MSQRRADVLLVLIAVIWGTTFMVVHEAVANVPALALIALRFGLAGLVFLPSLWQRRVELGRQGLWVGTLLGTILFTGFATQTIGLQYTTPARAGFITGLNVVLVPLLGLLFKQRPPLRAVIGVLLAMLGLVVLSWGCRVPWLGCSVTTGAGSVQVLGDVLVLVCALAFALHIVAVSRWATTLPVLQVNGIQLIVAALLAALATILSTGGFPRPTLGVWGAALFLGLIATAFVFALQLKLQRYTSATHTALIFALEPVFAALFSWLWTGEALTLAVWLGGSLMLLGVIAAEVPLPQTARRHNQGIVAAKQPLVDGDV